MSALIYFSSLSGNTARFVAGLDARALRIPVSPKQPMPRPTRPFVLICPTYADGQGRKAVPKQVIRFLNDPAHRAGLRGVIAGGNRNFGVFFGHAGDVIAAKCSVPMLYRFELAGTETDLARVNAGLGKLGLIKIPEVACSTL